MQPARYAAPALDKGLDILELFASEPAGLTASDAARRLGRTVGEIFRMLVCLEERGYISQGTSDERFELTLKLFELAHRHQPLHRLAMEARPLMEEVAHATGQSCHLAMLSNGEVIVVAQVDAPQTAGIAVKLGARIDLLNTASGHLILAFQQNAMRDRALSEWKRNTHRPAPAGLARHLARIRKRGYEEMPSYQVRGVTNIAFPVLNQHGEAIAALSVPFLARIGESIGTGSVKSALRTASQRLSNAVGGKKR
ncbi:MAG: IclR family transcriptional regulator [Candidatus Acidiferrales bacterium]